MSRNFALTARRDEYIGGVVIYWQASKHCNNSFCYRLCRHWCRSSHFKKLHVGIFFRGPVLPGPYMQGTYYMSPA